MKRVLILGCLSLMFLILGAAEKDRLTVMDVQDEANLFSNTTISTVTDYIFTKLQKTKIYWMIPKADRDTALEQAFDDTSEGSRRECVDEKCQMSLVAQLQANFLINTKIKKLYEGTCNISISKFDVEKRAGVDSWEEKFDCTEKGLYETIDSFDFGKPKNSLVQVKFVSTPPGADVFVNEKLVCQTPCSEMLETGGKMIVLSKTGYLSKTKRFEINKNQLINAQLQKKSTSDESGFGWLKVTGDYHLELTIDGKNVGRVPIDDLKISSGTHIIDHTNLCYNDYDKKIRIKKGEKTEINLDLTERKTKLTIFSEYSDGKEAAANVFVDGEEIGMAPGTFRVPLCSEKLVVKSRKGEFTTNLDLEADVNNKIYAVIKKTGRWSLIATKKKNWFDAKKYCENLKEGGYSSWQLPSFEELRALFSSSEYSDVEGYVFWSSTFNVGTGLLNAYYVSGGSYGVQAKFKKFNVICGR